MPKLKETFTAMPDLLLALFAGILTIVAPCTLPVLPILLGASVGRRSGARPALIAAGLAAAAFSFVSAFLRAQSSKLFVLICHCDGPRLRPVKSSKKPVLRGR